MYKYKFGVLGAGNMGSAIVKSAVDNDIFEKDRIIVFDSDAQKSAALQLKTACCAEEVIRNAEILLLSFKPQNLSGFASDLDKGGLQIADNQTIVSIMAGISTAKIRRYIKGGYSIIRIMPNLPMTVGAGVSAIFMGNADKTVSADIEKLFAATGEVFLVKEEQLDIFTALSGSGPGYILEFADYLISAAIENGIPPADAKRLALATIYGSAQLSIKTEENPADLRDKVTSKGGTTEQAIKVFRKANMRKIVSDAVTAAINKAKELGK